MTYNPFKFCFAMDALPELLKNYALFCKYRSDALATKQIDLSELEFIFPTTLLPLTDFVISDRAFGIVPPEDEVVADYIAFMLDGKPIPGGPRMPLRELPKDRSQADALIGEIAASQNRNNVCCGESAFKYFLGELVDNIYEHSEFSRALVMAQRYDSLRFVEMCFFDNGLTIPGAQAKHGKKRTPIESLQAAASGVSTKSVERGFGIGSSIRLATEGFNGKFLLVSGAAALSVDSSGGREFDLTGPLALDGTLVSIRIPFSSKDVNLYDYIG